ncbi:MAG: DNA-binding CsgD family transcriptional regulator [Moritella dasanensis]|jgi:DNA-binding CsgD family transcriptional regulator
MKKEQVEYTVQLLREGYALTEVAKLAGINVMYVSIIRKLMVMELLNMDA